MNRGDLPGFYYDQEKKKYFKIQANHIVSHDIKHSKGNVKQEKRQTKKRKVEEQKRTKRLKQTVNRNPLLTHPILGGTGLLREHGITSPSQNRHAEDQATVAGWKLKQIQVRGAAQPLSLTRCVNGNLLYAVGGRLISHKEGWADEEALDESLGHIELAYNTPITALDVHVADDFSVRIAVCTDDGADKGTLRLDSIFESDHGLSNSVGAVFTNGIGAPRPLRGVFQQSTGMVCCISGSRLSLCDRRWNIERSLLVRDATETFDDLDPHPLVADEDDIAEFGRPLDWLDLRTVAFSFNNPAAFRTVGLWDTRTSKGFSSRFQLVDKVTGILSPSNTPESPGGHQLVVSTNYEIGVYDTRMPHTPGRKDTPVVSFDHTHGGPSLLYTISDRGLIAAVDEHNYISVMSTRTGHTLPIPQPKQPQMIRSLQWYDHDGPTLLACGNTDLFRWSWDDTSPEWN